MPPTVGDAVRAAREPFALIGGAGADSLLRSHAHHAKRIGPAPTPFGLSAPLYRVRMGEARFLLMPRHGAPGEQLAAPWVNYRANIYALKEQDVERVLAWSECAAVNLSLSVGRLVLPHDLVDDTRGREASFFKGTARGALRQHPTFCPEMKAAVESTLHLLRLDPWLQGVYACVQGPRLETAAETRRLRSWGADMVGMTLAPEAFLARELEMCYFPLCVIARHAEGARERGADELAEALAEAEGASLSETLGQMFAIAASVSRATPFERSCSCPETMEPHRAAHEIEDDWHTWIGRP